ncbi:MAG: PQQ-binding-like beta-propeller repeat protein [Gemmataceae bacterium]
MRYRFALLLALTLVVGRPGVTLRSAETRGWRSDGSGDYPKAQPPLEWSTTKNVVWRTPMPGGSNSIPVLLGRRIFICAEPCTLLCLDREDGRILWQKNNAISEIEVDDVTRGKLKVELAEADRLNKLISGLNREGDLLRRKLKDDPAAKTEIDQKVKELRSKSDELKADKDKLKLASRFTERGREGTAGYSTPTPVTNGKEVFVAFGNGLVACFDLDGTRKWLKLIEQSTAPYAHGASPVLVGDKLLIHFADLVALSTRDGSECWRVKKNPPHGTPIATRLGAVDVVVTPHGLIVRVEDGAVLAENLGSCGANSPIVHDGIAYFVRGGATAVKLPSSLPAPAKIAALWKGKVKGGGYWFPSPVLHEGLLYAVDDRGIFSVIDASDGKLVYEERLELPGTHYPSVSVAGDRVYLSTDKGVTLVVACGREFKALARNELEPFRSSLVFEGKRMYVRTQKSLFCIGE